MFFPNIAFLRLYYLLTRLKNATTVLIYKKVHSVNLSSINEISTGKVVNVVTNDLNRLIGGLFVPSATVVPFVVVFIMVYLWTLFSYFSLFFVLAFAINTKISAVAARIKKDCLKKKSLAGDKRIKIVN